MLIASAADVKTGFTAASRWLVRSWVYCKCCSNLLWLVMPKAADLLNARKIVDLSVSGAWQMSLVTVGSVISVEWLWRWRYADRNWSRWQIWIKSVAGMTWKVEARLSDEHLYASVLVIREIRFMQISAWPSVPRSLRGYLCKFWGRCWYDIRWRWCKMVLTSNVIWFQHTWALVYSYVLKICKLNK